MNNDRTFLLQDSKPRMLLIQKQKPSGLEWMIAMLCDECNGALKVTEGSDGYIEFACERCNTIDRLPPDIIIKQKKFKTATKTKAGGLCKMCVNNSSCITMNEIAADKIIIKCSHHVKRSKDNKSKDGKCPNCGDTLQTTGGVKRNGKEFIHYSRAICCCGYRGRKHYEGSDDCLLCRRLHGEKV